MNHVEPLESKDPAGAKSTDGETHAQEKGEVVAGHGEKSEAAPNADEETRWKWAAKEAMARRLRQLKK